MGMKWQGGRVREGQRLGVARQIGLSGLRGVADRLRVPG